MTDETTEPTAGEPAETTQETADEALGEAGKKALIAERDARKKAEKQASEYRAQLDQIEQANLTELEKAQQRAEAAEAAVKAKEAETLRLTIAAKHGITGDHLDLLAGSTEDELEARAAKISALIQKSPRGPVIPGQGTTPDNPAPASADDWLRSLAKP